MGPLIPTRGAPTRWGQESRRSSRRYVPRSGETEAEAGYIIPTQRTRHSKGGGGGGGDRSSRVGWAGSTLAPPPVSAPCHWAAKERAKPRRSLAWTRRRKWKAELPHQVSCQRPDVGRTSINALSKKRRFTLLLRLFRWEKQLISRCCSSRSRFAASAM